MNGAKGWYSDRAFVFQCSSASRKFLNAPPRCSHAPPLSAVSVLFSEPKIPQLESDVSRRHDHQRFSALQRAENSSMNGAKGWYSDRAFVFQCSSASRKFLN